MGGGHNPRFARLQAGEWAKCDKAAVVENNAIRVTALLIQ
jgi:hypothetical protein